MDKVTKEFKYYVRLGRYLPKMIFGISLSIFFLYLSATTTKPFILPQSWRSHWILQPLSLEGPILSREHAKILFLILGLLTLLICIFAIAVSLLVRRNIIIDSTKITIPGPLTGRGKTIYYRDFFDINEFLISKHRFIIISTKDKENHSISTKFLDTREDYEEILSLLQDANIKGMLGEKHTGIDKNKVKAGPPVPTYIAAKVDLDNHEAIELLEQYSNTNVIRRQVKTEPPVPTYITKSVPPKGEASNYPQINEARELLKQNKPEEAIEKYNTVLSTLSPDDNPNLYVQVNSKLGDAYYTLSSTKDKDQNISKAINAYKEALMFLTSENNPLSYARVNYILGIIYSRLSYSKDRESNAEIAILYYEDALRGFTIKGSPLEYALAKKNLGNAHISLFDVHGKESDMLKAIRYFEDALEVCNLELSSTEHARIQSNLAEAYYKLSNVKNKEDNLTKATAAYEEAQKVYAEKFPMDYARVLHKLGDAYNELSEIEEEVSLPKAIASYEEALKVYTTESNPSKYAKIQTSLGEACLRFSNRADKKENLLRAIEAFDGALKFCTIENYPTVYAELKRNLAEAYSKLADEIDRESNILKSIAAYEAALGIYSAEEYPEYRALTQNDLGNVLISLSDFQDRETNILKALTFFDQAMRFLTAENYPSVHENISTNKKNAIRCLYESAAGI